MRATVPHPLAALAPSPRGRGLGSAAHRAYGPLLAVALVPLLAVPLVPLSVPLVPLRVALAARVARLVLALLSAAPLRFGLRAVVARADFESRDDLLLDFLADEPLDVAKVRAVFARDERHGLAGFPARPVRPMRWT